MAQPLLTGSFFDLWHINLWNAVYWGDECRFWKEANWRALIGDMHGIGIDTIILINAAVWGRPLFAGYEKTVGIPLKMGCPDPLGVCVDEAEKLGMTVFYGFGFRGRCSQVRDYADMKPPWIEEWFTWNRAVCEALVERYGGRPSFGGLYVSYEIDFFDYQVDLYEKLMKQYLRPAVGNVKFLASPGSLGDLEDIDRLPRDLERTTIDILAPQDYGGRGWDWKRDPMEFVRKNAEGLARIGQKVRNVGVRLWCNCEMFDHIASPDGRGNNVAGPFERIKQQLELQAPLAEKLICYQYQGIMNRHTDLVNIGHPGTDKLYRDYVQYREEYRKR